ncbi:hypothetical protein [Streptococcus catagoni]|uniref:hypothetical protein n=1 Tax=Streptococcus catagoni TaxID=2654874 RepID=UPI001408CD6A|nr:hypothetical protein [Streptococcus catagoni]
MINVGSTNELIKALSENVELIQISRNMTLASPISLPKGTSIEGIPQEDGTIPSLFFSHSDGIILQGQNTIRNLSIVAMQDKKGIMISPQQLESNWGKISLSNLEVDGQVSLIFRNPTLTADVTVENIHINSSDTRTYLEQPQKYGVNVLQGAFTLYNFNPDRDSLITASISGLTIGSQGHPVIGSGVFISGFNDEGGQVHVRNMEIGSVHSTGLIPQGVSDFITGAVFVVYGATVDYLEQNGKAITYGVNDMVLDAWGTVHEWRVNDEVISYGPSGVGFVNFGTVDKFTAEKSIATHGLGARAYNQYDGTLNNGHFHDIRTYNDGAVGIQISKKVGKILIDGDIMTNGGRGLSLVKGVNVELPAYALSIKDGGQVDLLTIKGDIITNGDKVTTIAMEKGGILKKVTHKGQILANGYQSEAFESNLAMEPFEKSSNS